VKEVRRRVLYSRKEELTDGEGQDLPQHRGEGGDRWTITVGKAEKE
jgi:hypothetical protein